MILLITHDIFVRIYCSYSRYYSYSSCQFYIQYSLLSEFRFILQFQFTSSSDSFLSFGSAILLIIRCVSVRINCSYSQFYSYSHFIHILILIHILNVNCSIILSFFNLVIIYPRTSHYLILVISLSHHSVLFLSIIVSVLHYQLPPSLPFVSSG